MCVLCVVACAALAQVIIYDALTNEVEASLTRFMDVAHGATFRSDGRLIVAGGQLPLVQVFDVATRSCLRQFRGHTGAIRVTRFAADNTHVVSMSDDKTVRLWDLTTEQSLLTLDQAHTDYIRGGCASVASHDVWYSGGYDHAVKTWDVRSSSRTQMAVYDHGAPVEVSGFQFDRRDYFF